ncbi:hypothetical protein ACSQ67_006260 [Phaseolus vulgaris]
MGRKPMYSLTVTHSSCDKQRFCSAENPSATGSSRLGDGKVEEPHRSQPVLQGPQEWHQKAKEASPHFHQRDGSQVFEEPEMQKIIFCIYWRSLIIRKEMLCYLSISLIVCFVIIKLREESFISNCYLCHVFTLQAKGCFDSGEFSLIPLLNQEWYDIKG